MSICDKLEVEITFDVIISKSTVSLFEILIDILFGSPVFFIIQMVPSASHSIKKKFILINSSSVNELSTLIPPPVLPRKSNMSKLFLKFLS